MKTILTALLTFLSLPTYAETLVGIAKTQDGRFAYREVHEVNRNSAGEVIAIKTSYFAAKENKFAMLHSDFSKHPFLPQTRFEDFRFKRVHEGSLNISMNADDSFYEINEFKDGKTTRSTKNKIQGTTVSGQGFDNYLVGQLLRKGADSDKIQFLVLARHDIFNFDIKKNMSAAPGEVSYRISPSNFLIRLFVKEIIITYSTANQQLLRYSGLSNLTSEKDESLFVTIDYGILK